MTQLIYGIRYREEAVLDWEWDRYNDYDYVQYANINRAYQEYRYLGYEWFVEELPKELIKDHLIRH